MCKFALTSSDDELNRVLNDHPELLESETKVLNILTQGIKNLKRAHAMIKSNTTIGKLVLEGVEG